VRVIIVLDTQPGRSQKIVASMRNAAT